MFRSAWWMLSFVVLGLPAMLPAGEVETAIVDFLEKCWSTSGTSKFDATAQFAALNSKAKVDARAHHAYTLLCIQQRRFEDAAKSAQDTLELQENYLPAWQAKIWLALLNKQYGAALAAAEKMGEISAMNRDTTEKERAHEAARFLGMVFGFVEGPVGENPATASARDIEKKLIASLTADQLETFKDARQTVVEKYSSFISDKAETKDKAIADEEAEKQRKIEDVTRRRDELASEVESNRKQHKELELKYQQQLAEITRADAPLADQLAAIEARAFNINQQLNQVQNDLSNLEISISRERDPVARAVLQGELNRVNRLANRINNDLFIANQNAQGIIARRNELRIRRQQLDVEIGSQIKNLENRMASVSGEQRRLDGIERQARKPSTGSGKGTAIGLTAKALNTYEPFPLERAKSQLLDSLR
jgi:hypothetical protein